MTDTNPLRADELRERLIDLIDHHIESGFDPRGVNLEKSGDLADAILALLTPPPSLASVVADAPDLKEIRKQLGELKIIANMSLNSHHFCTDDYRSAIEDISAGISAVGTALTISGNGWRDIESAPKDGTTIIACGPKLAVTAVHFHAERPPGWGSYLQFEPHWSRIQFRDVIGVINPTHWMPLPDAPQPKTGDA